MQHRAGVCDATERAEKSTDEGERRAFTEKQPTHLFRREAEREQRADLRGALLKTKLEQHRHQQQRRDDNEQAETDEQSAEVLRLLGSLERLFAHRLEAQAEFLGFEGGENFIFQRGAEGFSRSAAILGCGFTGHPCPVFRTGGRDAARTRRLGSLRYDVGRNRKPYRRQISKPVGPHLLAGGEGDEGFRCAAMVAPVIVILRADFVDEREGGIPLSGGLGLLDAGELRHERAIRPRHLHRHDAVDAEDVRPLREPRAGFRIEINQRQRIAGLRLQIIREPLADDDFVVAQTRRRPRRTGGGDHRVRRGVRADGDEVGEVGEEGLGVGVGGKRGAGDGWVEEDARGAQLKRTTTNVAVNFCVLQVPSVGQHFGSFGESKRRWCLRESKAKKMTPNVGNTVWKPLQKCIPLQVVVFFHP